MQLISCRRLARKYHPDKNPAGRERFVAVQKAYERLQAGAAAGQGPQAWRLLLILKVRCFGVLSTMLTVQTSTESLLWAMR